MEKHQRLKTARLKAGFRFATEAARALNVAEATYLAHENGSRIFDADSAERYARRYGTSVEWLLFGRGQPPAESKSLVEQFAPSLEVSASEKPPEAGTIPVLGTAAGSVIDMIEGMNIEGPVDFVERPHALRRAKDLYAIYVTGDSMAPMHRHGELRFVHPHRVARAGDTVVVHTRNHDRDPGQHYIKVLERRTSQTLYCRQLNPDGVLEIPTKFVRSVHRVLTMNEIFGV